jgi:cobalt-zinc-cadmium efflux system protein
MIDSMDHDHDHHARAAGHSHAHAHIDYGRAFAVGITLNLVYVAGEAIAGVLSGSLALIADAGHNLGDVLSLSLAWGAAVLSRRRPSDRFTYGLRSSSILAALANAIILLVVTGGVAWEAVRRISHPLPVASGIVIWVAAAGILVNGVTALLFASGRPRDLNLRSVFVHMAADTFVTAAVAASGIAIWLTGWLWLDPAVSLFVSAVIVLGTWGLVKSAIGLALNAVPESVDAAAVRAHLLTEPGVIGLHDLHIWGMSTTETALTCHLVMPDGDPQPDFLDVVYVGLQQRFGIGHPTIQIERGDRPCKLSPEHIV